MNSAPDFFEWCKKRNLDPFIKEEEKAEETESETVAPKGEVKAENSTKRASVRSHAYPELYGRGQYPDSYMRPIAADAVTYQDIEKKKK